MKKIKSLHSAPFLLLLITAQSYVPNISAQLPIGLNLPGDSYWNQDAQEANNNNNHFIEPSDITNYSDYRYVGAHNAHVYPRFFKIVRQQDQTILGMLSYGVRGLMLDTYYWDLGWPASIVGPSGAQVCLSHPTPGFLAFTQKGIFAYQALKYELRRVVEFMKVNTQAIITIIFEDYADSQITAKEIKEVMIEANYNPLFKPADLIDEQWPTLGWMRTNNKRLVIFSQRALTTDVTFREFNYMVENQYSTTDADELCTPRAESPSVGQLIVFNNFSGIALTLPPIVTQQQVDYDTVKTIISSCKVINFAQGKIFNGYWADHIIDSCNYLYNNSKKTIFEYINELNANPNKTTP